MRKIISYVMSVIIIIFFASIPQFFTLANEISYNCGDNCFWNYDAQTQTLTIFGEGDMFDFTSGSLFDEDFVDFYGSIENIIVDEGITYICSLAFENCINLKSVSLPNTLIEIGDRAFYNCSSLEQIDIPDGVTLIDDYAFENCTNLKQISFSESLNRIGEYAFAYTGLTEITIPSNVEYIGVGAFSYSKLEIVNIYANKMKFDKNVFSNTMLTKINTNSIENWCNYYFNGRIVSTNTDYDFCVNDVVVRDLFIPSGIIIMPNYAFCGCSSIETVEFSDTVQKIGNLTFSKCKKLKTVIIPANIKIISSGAFRASDNIENVYYEGTKEEFKQFGKVTVIYNDSSTVEYRNPFNEKAHIHYLYNLHEHNLVLQEKLEPTCTEKGYELYVCTICEEEYKTNYIDTIDHIYESYNVQPTCVERGYTLMYCTMCDYYYELDFIEKLGHSYINTFIDPTCTTNGINRYTCKDCGIIMDEYFGTLPHYYVFNSYNNEFFNYKCKYCDAVNRRKKDNLTKINQYINKTVDRGDESMFFDVVTDGVINAKDYAMLWRLAN